MKLPRVEQPAPRAGERYQNALRLMAVAEKMTRHGWRVDRVRIASHLAQAKMRAEIFKRRFLNLTHLPEKALGPAGAGQTDAVINHFRVTLKAPDVVFDKKTKRPQFNTAALIEYATQYAKAEFGPPAAALIGLRKNIKAMEFCNTYELFAAHNNGRIHFGFNPLGTQTGRWTSSTKLRAWCEDTGKRELYSVNAQQVPSKEPTFDFNDGKGPVKLVHSLRDIFIADERCVLLKADYDQLELRLIAYVYGVKKLIEVINNGHDAHIFTAAHLWPEFKLDPYARKPSKGDTSKAALLLAKLRDAAKPCAYAISYQAHDPKKDSRYPQLLKQIRTHLPRMTEVGVNILARNFFDTYPEIKNGQLTVMEAIENLGYAELSIDGRRLYYPATPRGFNQALNFPMQGTGGALCNRALLELEPTLVWEMGEQVRAQVHDELVVQAPCDTAHLVAERLEKAMSAPAQIGNTFAGIPAAADPGFNWGTCMGWQDFCALHPHWIQSRTTHQEP